MSVDRFRGCANSWQGQVRCDAYVRQAHECSLDKWRTSARILIADYAVAVG
jgi:hypothetical protein